MPRHLGTLPDLNAAKAQLERLKAIRLAPLPPIITTPIVAPERKERDWEEPDANPSQQVVTNAQSQAANFNSTANQLKEQIARLRNQRDDERRGRQAAETTTAQLRQELEAFKTQETTRQRAAATLAKPAPIWLNELRRYLAGVWDTLWVASSRERTANKIARSLGEHYRYVYNEELPTRFFPKALTWAQDLCKQRRQAELEMLERAMDDMVESLYRLIHSVKIDEADTFENE